MCARCFQHADSTADAQVQVCMDRQCYAAALSTLSAQLGEALLPGSSSANSMLRVNLRVGNSH